MEKHKIKESSKNSQNEHLLSIIYWLFKMETQKESDLEKNCFLERLVSKFVENDYAKTDRYFCYLLAFLVLLYLNSKIVRPFHFSFCF